VSSTSSSHANPPPFEVEYHDVEGARVIEIRGEVDLATVPELSDHLFKAAETDVPAVVVDLCQVSFMDSSGAHVLARARERFLAKGTRLAIACVPDGTPANVFSLTTVDTTFDVYSSRQDALRALIDSR
jgi:anti-sigma B factor antagonist